jgi:hypothetical protein
VAKASTILRSRVAELEEENARLQALAQKSASHDGNSHELMSEVEQLRARLVAAEQRERELSSQLSKRPIVVKTELSEPRLPTSPIRNSAFPAQPQSSDKTSASLSLLVSLTARRTEPAYLIVSFIGPTLRASFHIFDIDVFSICDANVQPLSPVKCSSERQLGSGFQDGLPLIRPTRLRLAHPKYHGP